MEDDQSLYFAKGRYVDWSRAERDHLGRANIRIIESYVINRSYLWLYILQCTQADLSFELSDHIHVLAEALYMIFGPAYTPGQPRSYVL